VGYWPTLYPKFDRVPTRVINEQRAIIDVLKGAKDLTGDVRELKIFDKAGQLDPHSPLLDSIRVYLSGRQSRKERTLGHDLVDEFTKPPCGWDPGAIRVGVAALVRSGALKVLINKKPFTNPADSELQDALRVVRAFDKVELVIEETEVQADVLTEVRSVVIKLTGLRKIDETPSAIFEVFGKFCEDMLGQAARVALWAEPAGLPLPAAFIEGREVFGKILALTNPTHRVNEIHAHKDNLEVYAHTIRTLNNFVTTWGKAYTEIRGLAASLGAVEHRLPGGGNCKAFLKNWQAAVEQRAMAQENTIKDLKNSKALAEQEMQKLIDTWRDEARKTVADALERLPKEVAGVGLGDMQETLAVPLNTFLAGLEAESDVVRVASLPERAARLVNEVAYAIKAEREKRQTELPGDEKPIKPLKRVRISEIAATVRIENEEQWNLVREKLDQTVRKELAAGNDVELG
jgi:hypothetical protein